MVDIGRVRAEWSGFTGGPGVSTFYFLDASGVASDLHDFLYAMANNIPPDVTIQIADSGDTLNEVTGAPTGLFTMDSTEPIVGRGGSDYAAPVGILVNWPTADVGPHRRIRGKTFFVPASSDSFYSDGQMVLVVRDSLQGAARAFATAQLDNYMVWHRPTGGAGGLAHTVTGADIPRKPCVLTSRRD
jgi:hypothetical protein